MSAAASSGVQRAGAITPVCHRAAVTPGSGPRGGADAAAGGRRPRMGSWPHADRHPALGTRGRPRPRPPARGARGRRGLHLRGAPRRVHPAGAGGRRHQPARAGHQCGHRLPPQPGPAGPPGLRPPAADPGPVHPGPRFPDPGPGGEAVRRLLRPTHRAHAGAGRGAPGHLRHLGDRRATGLPGRLLLAHLDAPDVQPRTAPLRDATHRHRRAGPADGAPGRRGGRRAVGHAVQHRRPLRPAHPARRAGGSGPGRTQALRAGGDR